MTTETAFDEALEQTGSENVEFAMIESSARLNTVALKSSHEMPEMASATAAMGVRVGVEVGMGVGAVVVG